MASTGQDLRHALRGLARRPSFALVAVLSLAAGIGVNTAVFTWIDYLVLAPVPGVDLGGLYLLEPRGETGTYTGTSWPEHRDFAQRLRTVAPVAAWRAAPVAVGDPGRSERVFAQFVSGSFFDALGLAVVQGRPLRPADTTTRGGPAVAVVSHGFWQTRLAGAPDAVGREVRVNGVPLTVVGVAPERFQGTVVGLDFDLWLPATLAPTLLAGVDDLEDRRARGYTVMGRLVPGATQAQAAGELRGVMTALGREYPETNTALGGEVLPFWQTPRGPQRMLAQGLAALQALLVLLLAAVCANLASLMLARSAARSREVGADRSKEEHQQGLQGRQPLGQHPLRPARRPPEREHLAAHRGVGLGVLAGQRRHHAAQLAGRLRLRRAGDEPAHHGVATGTAVLEVVDAGEQRRRRLRRRCSPASTTSRTVAPAATP